MLAAEEAAEEAEPPATTENALRALAGVGCHTEQGRRATNEDAETALGSLGPELPDHAFLAVYDGHGGSLAAVLAEKHMLPTLRLQPEYQRYVELYGHQQTGVSDEPKEAAPDEAAALLHSALRAAFLMLDTTVILPQLEDAEDRSGCTAIVVLVTPTHIVCANAGDSRSCFFGTESGVVTLSEDHKPGDPTELERITAAGGTVVGGRVDGRLAVARALGDPEYKDLPDLLPADRQKVTAAPDVKIVQRCASDLFVVVACDGIWDVMSNELCCELLHQRLVLGGEASDSAAAGLCASLCAVG